MTVLGKFNKLAVEFWKNEDGFVGGLISAGLGIVSSIFGKKSAKKEQAAANQGFDYLKDNDMVNHVQDQGRFATTAEGKALGRQGDRLDTQEGYLENQNDTYGLMAGLLGIGGQEANEEAFGAYKDSTGYNFRVDEGMRGIEGSRAAGGMLNSGATAKALMGYGQDMASQEFGNYMQQAGSLAQGQGNLASGQGNLAAGTARQASQYGSIADRGLNAALGVGQAGSSAGAGAASAIKSGTENTMSGIGGLVKGVASIFGF